MSKIVALMILVGGLQVGATLRGQNYQSETVLPLQPLDMTTASSPAVLRAEFTDGPMEITVSRTRAFSSTDPQVESVTVTCDDHVFRLPITFYDVDLNNTKARCLRDYDDVLVSLHMPVRVRPKDRTFRRLEAHTNTDVAAWAIKLPGDRVRRVEFP